jgi:hypothetical protein
MQERAEKTKVNNVFCIPKQLDGLKTLNHSFISDKFIHLLAIPSSLSRSYSPFPLCSGGQP